MTDRPHRFQTNDSAPTGQYEDARPRLVPDGGESAEEDSESSNEAPESTQESTDSTEESRDESGTEAAEESSVDRSNIDVTDAGQASPVDPKWEKPDIEDIPEVDGPKTRPASSSADDQGAASQESHQSPGHGGIGGDADPDSTAGMPNTARSPGQSRLKESGADGFIAALELCARLPDEVRLPEAAADLVPVALEAELEQDVQSFAAAEFDNPAPHVDTLEFVDVDGELWLKLRLGVSPDAFADLAPEEIRDHALQQIDGLL